MKKYKLTIFRKVKNSLFSEKDMYEITTKDSFDTVWEQFSYVASSILSIALDEIPSQTKVIDNESIKFLGTEYYTVASVCNPFN